MLRNPLKKRSYSSLKTITVSFFIVIGAIFYLWQNYFQENRAVLKWDYKQKIKPDNIGMINSDKLNQINYHGQAIIQVNNGLPNFSNEQIKFDGKSWEKYEDLDSLGRATQANAMLGKELMPNHERRRLEIKPTGWREYDLEINGQVQSLYNRAHLIAFQLTGEEDNKRNLITSTRQLNDPAMEFYESELKYYINQTGNHVRYQVTPIFRNNEKLSRGVHMMARSIEDNAISFNIYIFNVQPGVEINYQTGEAKF